MQKSIFRNCFRNHLAFSEFSTLTTFCVKFEEAFVKNIYKSKEFMKINKIFVNVSLTKHIFY